MSPHATQVKERKKRLKGKQESTESLEKEASLNEVSRVPRGASAAAGVDCDEGRSECVIALLGSFEKQHLRASVVP